MTANRFRGSLALLPVLSCALTFGGSQLSYAADSNDDDSNQRTNSLDPVLVTAQKLNGPQNVVSQGHLQKTVAHQRSVRSVNNFLEQRFHDRTVGNSHVFPRCLALADSQ